MKKPVLTLAVLSAILLVVLISVAGNSYLEIQELKQDIERLDNIITLQIEINDNNLELWEKQLDINDINSQMWDEQMNINEILRKVMFG